MPDLGVGDAVVAVGVVLVGFQGAGGSGCTRGTRRWGGSGWSVPAAGRGSRRPRRRCARSGRGPGCTVIWASGLPHHCRICSACTGPRVFSTRPNSPPTGRPGRRRRRRGARTSPPDAACGSRASRSRSGPAVGSASRRSPSRRRPSGRPSADASGVGLRSRVSWRRARSPTAVARRTSRVSVEPRSFNAWAPAATAASRSRASARSSSPYTLLVPGQRGLPRVDGEGPAVGGLAAAAFGLLGHEPPDRLLDEPVELGGADLVRDVGDVAVDVRGRLQRQEHGRAGDPAGPPRGQVALDHPGPDPAQAVAELDGLAEVGLAGLGREPDRGGELGHRELRDQGCTGSGDRHPGLAVVPHRGRLRQRVDRVHRRPGDRRLQLLGLRRLGRRRSSRPGELSTAAAVSRSRRGSLS